MKRQRQSASKVLNGFFARVATPSRSQVELSKRNIWQRLRIPSKMLYFPDEGHWVLKPQNSRLWYQTVNDWVDHWTKGKFR